MEPSDGPWIKRAFAAMGFGSSLAGFLFTVTAIPFAGLLFGQGVRDPMLYAFACFPLASAGILLALVSFLSPSLVLSGRFDFPLNWTIPTVYCGLVLVASMAMSAFRPPIAWIGDAPRIDQVWSRPDFLATAWVVQIVGMSMALSISRRGKEATS